MTSFNDLNNTSKFLSHLVFQGESFKVLRNFGLENVYVGDYGFKRIHEYCLYFLVNPTMSIDNDSYQKFEDKITSFNSFYDWYDVIDNDIEKRMYVFTIHSSYREDFYSFLNNKFDNLSDSYWASLGAKVKLNIDDIDFLIENEVYRFSDSLKVKRETNNLP